MKVFINYKDGLYFEKDNYNNLIKRFPFFKWTDKLIDSYDANMIIAYPGFCTKKNLDKYSKLHTIQLLTAGFDTIDLDYLDSRDIELLQAEDVFSVPIAENVIGKILYFNENMKMYQQNMNDKNWNRVESKYDIAGSTIGIIGAGSIGYEVAKRLRNFDVKSIIGYRRSNEHVAYFDKIYTTNKGLKTILESSDYIILAVPLNDATHHLINKRSINLMKKDALLINVARGEVINQEDLINALENNQIRGAALDVTHPEPLSKDNRLWELDNVYITPHVSNSSKTIDRRLELALKEVLNRY